MRRRFSGIALLALACASVPPAPRKDPIPAAMLCSAQAEAAASTTEDKEACTAAIQERLSAMQRSVLERWTFPGDTALTSMVQVQFTLDAEGRPRDVCVLGGTGGREAREALAALAKFEPRAPLDAAERCALGEPFVSTFTTSTR